MNFFEVFHNFLQGLSLDNILLEAYLAFLARPVINHIEASDVGLWSGRRLLEPTLWD